MNLAVIFSGIMLFSVIYIPKVNAIFDNTSLPLIAWLPMIILALIPFTASELLKVIRVKK